MQQVCVELLENLKTFFQSIFLDFWIILGIFQQKILLNFVQIALQFGTETARVAIQNLDGSIVTEDRVMELSGFYGQFAVLMFIADAWYTLFGFIFAVYFLVNSSKEARLARANKPEDEKVGDYQAYKESIDAPPSPTKSDSSDEYVKVV